jgi:hypothetical protein
MRLTRNVVAMVEHRGPEFDYWRERCLAAFGGVALDEARDSQ